MIYYKFRTIHRSSMGSIALGRKQWNSSWGKKISSFPLSTLCFILHFLFKYGKFLSSWYKRSCWECDNESYHISTGIEPMFIMKFEEAIIIYTCHYKSVCFCTQMTWCPHHVAKLETYEIFQLIHKCITHFSFFTAGISRNIRSHTCD